MLFDERCAVFLLLLVVKCHTLLLSVSHNLATASLGVEPKPDL